jgi:hypothetical protein
VRAGDWTAFVAAHSLDNLNAASEAAVLTLARGKSRAGVHGRRSAGPING